MGAIRFLNELAVDWLAVVVIHVVWFIVALPAWMPVILYLV